MNPRLPTYAFFASPLTFAVMSPLLPLSELTRASLAVMFASSWILFLIIYCWWNSLSLVEILNSHEYFLEIEKKMFAEKSEADKE